MLDEVKAGRVNGVIAWHTDRLHRRAAELEEFVQIAETHALQVQTVSAGEVDLSTASGRMVARMLGAAAQHEVDHARERMRRAKAQAAEQGKFRGGRRPYGYEADGVTVRESEAEVVRDASKAVLAGRSLAAVARELNERGLAAERMKRNPETDELEPVQVEWTYGRLRDVLTRPRNAGLLHRGRYDRGTGEIVGKAVWPAIVDEDTWRAVHTMLTDPSRRMTASTAVKWLGSGLYVCGRCGGRLRPAPNRWGRGRLYRCVDNPHLTINAEETDEHVRGVIAALVRDPRVVEAMEPAETHTEVDRARRAALTLRLGNFEDDYAAGRITGAQLQRATESVEAELAQVDERLTSGLRRSTASPVLNAPDPGAAFLAAPIDVQRAVLAAVLTVEVLPAPKRGGRWTSERLRIISVS